MRQDAAAFDQNARERRVVGHPPRVGPLGDEDLPVKPAATSRIENALRSPGDDPRTAAGPLQRSLRGGAFRDRSSCGELPQQAIPEVTKRSAGAGTEPSR